jgi:hypothetical protein
MESDAMWARIRTALLRPLTIVVLALLFLVTDALLSMFSPASTAAHPELRSSRVSGETSPL